MTSYVVYEIFCDFKEEEFHLERLASFYSREAAEEYADTLLCAHTIVEEQADEHEDMWNDLMYHPILFGNN